VVLDDPGNLRAYVRRMIAASEFGVIVRRQLVADIVNQCRQQQLIVGAIVERAGRTCRQCPSRLTG